MKSVFMVSFLAYSFSAQALPLVPLDAKPMSADQAAVETLTDTKVDRLTSARVTEIEKGDVFTFPKGYEFRKIAGSSDSWEFKGLSGFCGEAKFHTSPEVDVVKLQENLQWKVTGITTGTASNRASITHFQLSSTGTPARIVTFTCLTHSLDDLADDLGKAGIKLTRTTVKRTTVETIAYDSTGSGQDFEARRPIWDGQTGDRRPIRPPGTR